MRPALDLTYWNQRTPQTRLDTPKTRVRDAMRRRSGAPGSKKRPGVRRTSRPAGGRRSLLPAHLSHHLYASNRHRWLQACSIAQRGSALMPRQPSGSAGSGTRGRGACLGVGRPQLLTSCCTFSTVQAASPVPAARPVSLAPRRDSVPFLVPSRSGQPAGCSSKPKRVPTGCSRGRGTPGGRSNSPACSAAAACT